MRCLWAALRLLSRQLLVRRRDALRGTLSAATRTRLRDQSADCRCPVCFRAHAESVDQLTWHDTVPQSTGFGTLTTSLARSANRPFLQPSAGRFLGQALPSSDRTFRPARERPRRGARREAGAGGLAGPRHTFRGRVAWLLTRVPCCRCLSCLVLTVRHRQPWRPLEICNYVADGARTTVKSNPAAQCSLY